jgi:hypothetical protein
VTPSTSVRRRSTLRLLTAGIAIGTLRHLPSPSALPEPDPGRPRRGARADARQARERRVASVALLLWGCGNRSPAVALTANLATLRLLARDAKAISGAFNYTAHVNLFLLLQSLPGCVAPHPNVLASMRLTLLGDYFLAGTAKVLRNRGDWLRGSTLRASWYESDTRVGWWLAKRRRLARAASLATLVLELGALPAYAFFPQSRNMLAASLCLFHATTKTTMGISFWPLSFYIPAVLTEGVFSDEW